MEYRITTDLVIEPVTLAEAKAQIVADYTIDDTLITNKIKTARQWLENYTGLAFGEKTIRAYYDFLDTDFSLPIGPIIGDITSVTRTVSGTDTVLVANTDYWVTGYGYPVLDFTNVWTSCGRARTSYSVIYQAGYNEDNLLPEPIKEAILKLTAELYRDRENTISGTINTMLPYHVRSLVSPYRRNVLL
jgi:uncharacterized phiE125 gp8 family phage protein